MPSRVILCPFLEIRAQLKNFQLQFELVSSVVALEATKPVSEPGFQMAVALINNHLISVQQKRGV